MFSSVIHMTIKHDLPSFLKSLFMSPKDVDGMTNSVDPDQTAPV